MAGKGFRLSKSGEARETKVGRPPGEQTSPVEGRGVAYQITPWGRQAMSHLEIHHPAAVAAKPVGQQKVAGKRAGKAAPVARVSSARASAPAAPRTRNGAKRDDR